MAEFPKNHDLAESAHEVGRGHSTPRPFARLRQLLQPERRDIVTVVVFAVTVSVLSLATPIAVESLVNMVAFGVLMWPVVVIAGILMTCLGLAAAVRAMQVYVVECIQRRLFVRVVADYAHRLPRLKVEGFDHRYGPELVNRFFDVLNLQKSLAVLLLDGVALVVTALVGMVVLAFYHPYLLGFDILLIAFTLFVLGWGGVRTSLHESHAKYDVAAWLEELLRCLRALKFAGGQQLAREKADQLAGESRSLPARRLPPPAGVSVRAEARPAPAAKPPVLPAAHVESQPAEKLATAQPPPQPGVDPEAKPGSIPPAPPKDLPPVSGSPPSVGGPLALDEVLFSVERNYPLLRAVEQERALAGGRLVSTMGAFDLNLTAGADGQGTTYDNFRSTAGVSQGLPVGGIGAFAGYRNGYGEFPTYNLGQKTADGGEFRAGLTIPLFRDRAIDRPRANIQQARLDVALAEPVIERQRLDFQRAASRTYWNWVAAGQRLKVVESLVKLAVERDDQLKARVEAGPAANIERIDNQQNIALRNGVLVQAQRGFQQATIDLSLFLRDGSGSPTLAGTDRLPAFPDVRPIDVKTFDASLQTAFDLRPEPRRLRLQREKAAVELRLATNQTLPSVNAVGAASQDVGPGKSSLSGPNGLDRTTLSAGGAFQLPVQQRDARGRVQVAQAQLAQIDQQLRQAEDVVRADVQDAFSALERAFEFNQQAKKRVELARLVARAEREQLRLGRSDVLRVTLREQATFDAEIVEIGAQQDFFRVQADFRAALGVGGK